MSYRKLRPGDDGFLIVEAHKQAGHKVCDAVTHNNPTGCRNPDCFKFQADPRKAPRTVRKDPR